MTGKPDELPLGKEALSDVLDQDAADRRHNAFVAKAKNDLQLRHAVEARNELLAEDEKSKLGVDAEEARKILGAVQREAIGEAESKATQPRMSAPAAQKKANRQGAKGAKTGEGGTEEQDEGSGEPDETVVAAPASRANDRRKLSLGLLAVFAGTLALALLFALLINRGSTPTEGSAAAPREPIVAPLTSAPVDAPTVPTATSAPTTPVSVAPVVTSAAPTIGPIKTTARPSSSPGRPPSTGETPIFPP